MALPSLVTRPDAVLATSSARVAHSSLCACTDRRRARRPRFAPGAHTPAAHAGFRRCRWTTSARSMLAPFTHSLARMRATISASSFSSSVLSQKIIAIAPGTLPFFQCRWRGQYRQGSRKEHTMAPVSRSAPEPNGSQQAMARPCCPGSSQPVVDAPAALARRPQARCGLERREVGDAAGNETPPQHSPPLALPPHQQAPTLPPPLSSPGTAAPQGECTASALRPLSCRRRSRRRPAHCQAPVAQPLVPAAAGSAASAAAAASSRHPG